MLTVLMSQSGEELPPFLDVNRFVAESGGTFQSGDPRTEPLLQGASTAVRRYCGWHVAPRVEEETVLDYEGGSVLVLPTLRLESVEELEIYGEAIDPSRLRVSRNGEIRIPEWRRMGLGDGFGAIKVKMRHGFDPEEAPELAEVVRQVVANALSSPMGATQERAGQVSMVWAQTAPGVSGGISLLERDLRILDSYRLPGGA